MTRHKARSLLAGLLCLGFWPDAAQGQSPELQEAYDLFEILYVKDYYEEALPVAQTALSWVIRNLAPNIRSPRH